jgi:hypothetical protein
MMNKSISMLVISILLISAGIGGVVFAGEDYDTTVYNRIGIRGAVSEDINNRYLLMGSMMSGFYGNSGILTNDEVYPLEVLTEEVEQYIAIYDTELAISDIFVYENSEYYYSIIEKDTGKGAMELLVNPYTKAIYPEYGPNMMWNLKYGMHQYGGYMGYGMMGRGFTGRGVMGYYYDGYDDFYSYDFTDENDLTYEEAYNEALEYLAIYNPELSVADDYHEFYGYYTFHVNKSDETVGMLSVNGYTGTVWIHDWHGELVEIVEGHE